MTHPTRLPRFSLSPWLPRWLAGLALLCALPASATPPLDLSTWDCVGHCGAIGADGDIALSPLGSARHGFVTTSDSGATGVSPLALDANSRGLGTETNGSRWRSASFAAVAGEQLAVAFNYVSTDGKGFDDYAWARLVSASDGALVAWLFTARSSNSGTRNIVPGDVVSRRDFDPRAVIVDFDAFDFHSKTAADPVDWSPLGFSNGTCWKDNAAGCGYTGWLLARHQLAAGGSYRLEVGVVNWGDGAFDSGLAFDIAGLQAPVPEAPSSGLMLAGLAGGALAWRRRGPLRRAPRAQPA